MVHPSQRRSPYAARKSSWSLTIKRGDAARSYAIRPWLMGSALGLFVALLVAYVGATAYLVYRDDIIGAAVSRQVKMQYAYEERVAALRSELDRLSSRHAVQTENVEQQLSRLLEQQASIEDRQAALDSLVGQARAAGIAIAEGAARVPRARPDETPSAGESAGSIAQNGGIRPVLSRVGSSLDDAEASQADALDALSAAASDDAARITDALTAIGVNVGGPADSESEPQGGPFIPAEGLHFVERAALLKRTLDGVEELRRDAALLPLRVPVRAHHFSSRYGYRVDPFLKRPAFHAGLDFVANAGTTVRATGSGTVVSAGRNGGYGVMVEIAHADGLTTRYGHLSQALVTRGMYVAAGASIGRVGSTGRSTGPHLHYETRRDGAPVDPTLYLAAGRALRGGS
jgi:murein DD-endopeptidase MepM/ murein hydrolase activator NlpD